MNEKEKKMFEKIKAEMRKEWEEDGEQFTEEELNQAVQWELDSKENFKNYVVSEERESKAGKCKQLDKNKVFALLDIYESINDKFEGVDIINPQKEIMFYIDDDIYSLSISKHTKKWKGVKESKPEIIEQFEKLKEEYYN